MGTYGVRWRWPTEDTACEATSRPPGRLPMLRLALRTCRHPGFARSVSSLIHDPRPRPVWLQSQN